jgi:MFS family permease
MADGCFVCADQTHSLRGLHMQTSSRDDRMSTRFQKQQPPRRRRRIVTNFLDSKGNLRRTAAVTCFLVVLIAVVVIDCPLADASLKPGRSQSMSELRRRRRIMTTTVRGGASASVSPTAAASARTSISTPGTSSPAQQQHELGRPASVGASAAPPQVQQASMTATTAPSEGVSAPPATMTDDTHNRQVLQLIRVLFLAYYGSLGSLLPYLPVYYHSLGHGGLIIGMLGAVKPLTTFLVAPFWGILSDKSDKRFRILYFTFAVSCVGQLLVAFRNDVWFLMGMVFITAFFNAPVKSLIDTLVMDHLSDRRDYGRLRLWGQLGFGLGSSGVGMMLNKSNKNQQLRENADAGTVPLEPFDGGGSVVWPMMNQLYKFWQNLTGYRLLFFTYAALSIPTWLCLKAFERMDEEKEQRQKAVASETKKKDGAHIKEGLQLLLHNGDALLFFFLVFVVGVSSGIIENFAYVRMREVGGSGKEMGFSRLVSSAAGAPMFWFSGPLTERLGADRVLVLSLLSYVTRFFLYSFMRHPYHGLPAEALRGVTFAAFWSTGTVYAHRISPPGMEATMVSLIVRLDYDASRSSDISPALSLALGHSSCF